MPTHGVVSELFSYLRIMKKSALLLAALAIGFLGASSQSDFVQVKGKDLIQPDGQKLFIQGTNLGNWLNPEGYMFKFKKTSSARFINEMFCQLVGPDATNDFWREFKDNYVTRDDIQFIRNTGSNTVRLPLHYKLFTDEDYMGLSSHQDGFARIDSVVTWCREAGLYLILDMHDAPGGQTGDNIDDSYGYPWLFKSERSQQLLCDIWKQIAKRYKDEPVVLGYELINEPIPHYREDKEELKTLLEPLYKRCTKAIRSVDKNHIILLGGAEWNGKFDCFSEFSFDDNIMYTCHRYGGEPTAKYIDTIIEFRDRTGLPMYMGETGHNTDEWQEAFCKVLKENNIGYTFWPYKKLEGQTFMSIPVPENWEAIVDFAESDRSSYQNIQKARPDQAMALKAMQDFIEACKFKNCTPQASYIRSIGLQVPQ